MLIWVDGDSVVTRPTVELPLELGGKAAGLLRVPSAWVPPFVAVSPRLMTEFAAASPADHPVLVAHWCRLIEAALKLRGIDLQKPLILRSNAVVEKLQDRGSYCSRRSTVTDLPSNLQVLLSDLEPRAANVPLGLIVQEHIDAIVIGHLSNERGVARETRDAEILSTVVDTGEMYEQKIGHRNWRHSGPVTDRPLRCSTADAIKKVLHEPLALTARRGDRMHYEWVWDGRVVRIVQADPAPDHVGGVAPSNVLRFTPVPSAVTGLKRFTIATPSTATDTAKLRSHMTYAAAGFWQPTFHVLNDAQVIASIANGLLPPDVESDFAELLTAPLIVRTACRDGAVPLLPRSHLLTDLDGVRAWLLEDLAKGIHAKGLAHDAVTLLVHHYIPARAAAFSHCVPDKPDVFVESLWGVPEGLYYLPCDNFIVSMPATLPVTQGDFTGFAARERLRYKSHFVAPDASGRFERHRVAKPWDWKRTIGSEDVLFRMARFTRAVADERGHGINMMWFLDCETPDGAQDLVPWYQEKLDALDRGTDFSRNARDELFEVSTREDLATLRARTNPPESGRLLLKLSPAEHIALRDDSFARCVGEEAKRLNAIVLLRGARLAHIYYVLTKAGADVVVKPIGEETHCRTKHSLKLVRDRIPQKVAEGGESVTVARLSPQERVFALKLKLIEEAFEVRDALADDIVEELADVYEVLLALLREAGVAFEDLEAVRTEKAESRGGFAEGIQLLETSFPAEEPLPSSLLAEEDAPRGQIMHAQKPQPFERVTVGGSDLRRTGVFSEFVKDLSVSLSQTSWGRVVKTSGLHGANVDMATVIIEGHRQGTDLRMRIRLRIGTQQLELPLGAET